MALTAVGGLLLTGCGAGDTGGSGGGYSADGPERGGGLPAPAPEYNQGTGEQHDDQDEDFRERAPGYLSTFALDVDTASYGYATAVEGLREGPTNRVVLVSDALANTGDTDPDSILERIADARREHGITLFGVGSDYGDALMERLADKGDARTARDANAQVAFDPETVTEFRLVGYDNRQVADDEVGPGHTVTALYAVRPT